MFRVFKLALVALLAYAIATATPTQQVAVIQGARALGEAVVAACTREDSLCQRGIGLLTSALPGANDDSDKTSLSQIRPSSHPSTSPFAPSSQKWPASPITLRQGTETPGATD